MSAGGVAWEDRLRQIPLDFQRRPGLGVEDYLVAAPNREAAALTGEPGRWPGRRLAVAGPEGAGKTHLLSIAVAREPEAVLVDGAALDPESAGRLASARLVAVDDADRAAGRAEGEDALFHLYNLMAAGGGHLLVAARRPPAAWPAIRPDLVSRLATFGVVEIGAPDDALLSSVLLKAAADRGLDVAPAAVAHVLARIERSFAAVHAAVAVLDAHAADRRRRGVTLRMASEVLRGGHTAAPEPGAGHSREE